MLKTHCAFQQLPGEAGWFRCFADSSVRHINIESIVDVLDDPNLAAVVADPYEVLRSADELLPLCHRFNGYAMFRELCLSRELRLWKNLWEYGDFMEYKHYRASFSRCATFRALGLVLHGMDTTQLLDITDHRLLCWRDAICEAMTLGFRVDFLLSLVRDFARAVFGARAVHSMELSSCPNEIRAAAEALSLKQRELENQHRELHALLLAQGVSADGASCVAEATTRSSCKASDVLF
ncbi:hypothetical protein Pyn_34317 [Prunus yedoensis var. nudiflora]|uniref:Uncharacterized protein n=1 Tax=Prunus yedoensis var. nudiflora TaxID=2094558 RepID=A0A314ZJ62_PRUYE|nr:hypothetical protein Pyn_34317 [Prunus yedoensis var. nudiflora]